MLIRHHIAEGDACAHVNCITRTRMRPRRVGAQAHNQCREELHSSSTNYNLQMRPVRPQYSLTTARWRAALDRARICVRFRALAPLTTHTHTNTRVRAHEHTHTHTHILTFKGETHILWYAPRAQKGRQLIIRRAVDLRTHTL